MRKPSRSRTSITTAPIFNFSPQARFLVFGGVWQGRAGTARHDAVAWAYARGASGLGVDIIQNCEVTGISRGTDGAVTGLGQMVEIGGAWAFAMQMSTDRVGTRVLHWANMVQTREGDPSWQQLPGLTHSVPEMLAGAVYPRLAAG